MKKLILLTLLASFAQGKQFVVAESCDRTPVDVNTVPFEIDPNEIAGFYLVGYEIVCQGPTFYWDIVCCDDEGDSYILEPISLPKGMTWDAAKNQIKWTPPTAGIYYVKITVTDDPNRPCATRATGKYVWAIQVPEKNTPPFPEMRPVRN
ncbi:MAG: Ig domain-containing protein [Phycisphaerae bacterium]|nr:Ig domain-containing protein [Phycisphaerae bacterium]